MAGALATEAMEVATANAINTTGALPNNLANQQFADTVARNKQNDNHVIELGHNRAVADRFWQKDLFEWSTTEARASVQSATDDAGAARMIAAGSAFAAILSMGRNILTSPRDETKA